MTSSAGPRPPAHLRRRFRAPPPAARRLCLWVARTLMMYFPGSFGPLHFGVLHCRGGGLGNSTCSPPNIWASFIAAPVPTARASASSAHGLCGTYRRVPPKSRISTLLPIPCRPGQPGELIRSAPFYEYQLSYKVSVVRILYHSRSPTGQDVAASGVADGFQTRRLSPGGWPVIAWAHEFTGSAPQCAPLLRSATSTTAHCFPCMRAWVSPSWPQTELGLGMVSARRL